MTRLAGAMLAALLAAGLAGGWVAVRARASFTDYQSPFALAERSRDAAPPLARPVVFVLVDGLRLDASRAMPFLAALRGRGADLACRVGSPSLSMPGRGVLMSGAWSEVHGQLLNFKPRPLAVESLFESARRHGLRTALASDPKVQTLFAPHVDERLDWPPESLVEGRPLASYLADLPKTTDAAIRLLQERRPDLLAVDLVATDQAAHDWGGSSAEYRAVVQETDRALQRLAAAMDLERSVLVVTSDHGHVDRGGHGGDEPSVMSVPLVLAGHGIRAGVTGDARQIDVAPTLATILGVPIPSSSQGDILDVLDGDDTARAERRRVLQAQRARADRAYVERLAGSGTAAASRAARLAGESAARRVGAAGMAAAPLAMLVFGVMVGGARVAVPSLLLGAGGTLLNAGLRALAGISPSLSALNKDEALPRFLAVDMALAALIVIIVAIAAGAWSRRQGIDVRPGERRLLSALAAVAFATPLVATLADAYWKTGLVMTWALPDMRTMLGVYYDALALCAVGLAAPLLPLAARLGAGLVPVSAAERS
jgi:hypothetical protein